MPRKLTQDEFIEKATKIHKGKYDYSKSEYVNNRTDVIITCPEHGDFKQAPDPHFRGQGCPVCRYIKAKETIRKKQGLTKEEFILKARQVHGWKYDYSKVEYENTDTDVIIICPEHGEFKQTPHHHLGGSGCQICGRNDLSENKLLKIIEDNFENVVYQFKPEFLKNNGKSQSIDIYLPDYKIGIEYQGRQHFKPISRFGGKSEYEKIIERDKRKFNISKENGIEILYFTYEKENEIPKKYLNKIYKNEDEIITEIKNKIAYD